MSEKSHWVRAVPVPDKPTGLSATVVSHDAVTLAWDNPQDDAITGYVILRRDRAIHPVGTSPSQATPARRTTTYTDANGSSRRQARTTGSGPRRSTPQRHAQGRSEVLTVNTTGIADADGLTTSTYSYQWVASDGTTDTDIPEATDDTYTLVADDEGKTIRCG